MYISKKHKVITQTILNMHMIIVRSGFTDRRQQYGCLDKQDTRMSAHMLLITYFTIHNILRLENDLSWGTYVVGNNLATTEHKHKQIVKSIDVH